MDDWGWTYLSSAILYEVNAWNFTCTLHLDAGPGGWQETPAAPNMTVLHAATQGTVPCSSCSATYITRDAYANLCHG